MKANIPVQLVFEDAISEFTMTTLLSCFGNKFLVCASYPGFGFGYIKNNINGFNDAAVISPFFVLTDLDQYNCAITLKQEWLKKPEAPNLIFRVAVREVESWLLSDIEGFSEFSGVSAANFPLQPEKEKDPKQTLINLISRSRKRAVREDIVPINNNAKIGPNYNERLMQFVSNHWSVNRAMVRSESLQRAYDHLSKFTYKLPEN